MVASAEGKVAIAAIENSETKACKTIVIKREGCEESAMPWSPFKPDSDLT